MVNFYASSPKPQNLPFGRLVLSKAYKVLDKKKYRRVMSHDTEEWSKVNLILEKYAFFVWCNRLAAVSGRYSQSVGKIFDNCLRWISFYS